MTEKKILREFGDLYIWLGLDQAQLEMRILAEMADCKRLIKVMNTPGLDIHSAVGSDLTGKDPAIYSSKNKDQKPRVWIKSLHFSLVYGKTVQGLYEELISKGIETTLEEVQGFVDAYFDKYPEVLEYITSRREFTEKYGYGETLFGMKREIDKNKEGKGAFWGNQAINSPIQGTAGQLIMITIAEIKKRPKTYNILRRSDDGKCPIKLEVHDALYWRILLRDLQEGFHQAKHLMEIGVKEGIERRFGFELRVPLLADGKAGFRYGALASYEGEPVHEFIPKWLKFNAEIDKEIDKSLEKIAQ